MTILAWLKKHKWLSIFIALLIIGLCALAYDVIAYKLDKKAWIQANESIESIYSDVDAKVGSPDDHLTHKSCGGAIGPYGESSEILCQISISFIFPASDLSSASKLKDKIRSLVNARSDWLDDTSPHESSFLTENEGGPTIDYYKTNKGVGCQAFYIFDPSFDTRLKLRKPSKQKQFYASLSCVGSARGKFFSDKQ